MGDDQKTTPPEPAITADETPVITAPLWLLQRMKALQQRPPPTLHEVETSFRAAEETRSKCEDNPSSSANGRKKLAA